MGEVKKKSFLTLAKTDFCCHLYVFMTSWLCATKLSPVCFSDMRMNFPRRKTCYSDYFHSTWMQHDNWILCFLSLTPPQIQPVDSRGGNVYHCLPLFTTVYKGGTDCFFFCKQRKLDWPEATDSSYLRRSVSSRKQRLVLQNLLEVIFPLRKIILLIIVTSHRPS